MRTPMHRTSPLLHLLILLSILWSGAAGAVTVEDLYTARIDVADKGRETRSEAFREGLKRVIVRIAGRDDVLDQANVEDLLKEPAGYVQQFQYTRIEGAQTGDDAASDDGAAASGAGDGGASGAGEDGEASKAEPKPTHRLVVRYAGQRIVRDLENRGIAVWGRQRPEVLVWLAVDDGRRRYVVSADGDSTVHAQLSRAAQRRGLPLLLPLLDTLDRRRVDYLDIKGGFFDAVRDASRRYRAQTLLVGYVERRGGRWLGDWHLLGLGERRAWRDRAEAMGDVVAAGVAGATERLASAFAGREGEVNPVRLQVRGVSDLDGYARLTDYVQQLPRVRSARLVGIGADEALFRVEVQGPVAQLQRAIALGDTLVEPQRTRRAGAAQAGDAGESGGDRPADEARDKPARMPARQRVPVPELVYRLAG